MATRKSAKLLPWDCILIIASGTIFAAVPRQPACKAATCPVFTSPIKTGVQSAEATHTACKGW